MTIDVSLSLPEFSRIVSLDQFDPTNPVTEIAANSDECIALARRFDLLQLDAFTARVTLEVSSPTTIVVSASYVAQVSQACVVTLEPVSACITERFERRFVCAPVSGLAEVTVDPMADDPPEPWDGGAIDIGEMVAEQMGLAIDPYPRAPGAVFRNTPEKDYDARAPFSALVALKEP